MQFQPTKKTAEEILARIESVKDADWMGIQRSDLICYLPFAQAKPHLEDGVTQTMWESERTVKPPLQEVFEYLEFAWDKANNQRGLSASRSLDHLKAWLWLAGFDSLVADHFPIYNAYGKKQLIIASIIVGFPWDKHDDGEWEGVDDIPREVAKAQTIAAEALQNVVAPTYEDAVAAYDEYQRGFAGGGEPHFPQWAADLIAEHNRKQSGVAAKDRA